MSARIRLKRMGRKGQPSYRIVVADQRKAREGAIVATLGHYNPRTKDPVIVVDAERARAWLAKGAQPSDTVRSLLKKAGVFAVPAPATPGA
jgi:small subunit ribosomal protein S16